MQINRSYSALFGAGIVVLALSGCADRNKNGQPDSAATTSEIANTVDNAGDKMEGAASNAASAMSDAASSAGKAISNAGEAALMTPKVSAALKTNPGLKGEKIDVDTKGAKDSITLSGTVKTAAQKKIALAIAKKTAPGYHIVDELKVGG